MPDLWVSPHTTASVYMWCSELLMDVDIFLFRRFIYARQMLDLNCLGDGSRSVWEEASCHTRRLLRVSIKLKRLLLPQILALIKVLFYFILSPPPFFIMGSSILVINISRVIFNTLFGLSTSYWMAIATRFLLGALNGLLGPIKVL